MTKRKATISGPKPPEFPELVCGVCFFCHVSTAGEGLCSASPPLPATAEDGVYFYRHGRVDMNEPICATFKPRHHA